MFPDNKTDALVIVEKGRHVERVFACIILNMRTKTLLPIICSHVAVGSTVHTNKHKIYSALGKIGFIHSILFQLQNGKLQLQNEKLQLQNEKLQFQNENFQFQNENFQFQKKMFQK